MRFTRRRDFVRRQERDRRERGWVRSRLRDEDRRPRSLDLALLPIAAFLRCWVVKQGFRDGIQGLIIALFTAYSVFLKYAKLWELDRGRYERLQPGSGE